MLRSTVAGLVLSACATTASAVPITDFTGLSVDLSVAVASGSGNVVSTGTTSGSAEISNGAEFTGLGFARGLGPTIVFLVDIRSDGSAELFVSSGNSVVDGAPFSYSVDLAFTDPGIRITDVLGASNPFSPGMLTDSFSDDTISLDIASVVAGSFNIVGVQSGQFVSFQIEAETVGADVPLPAGLPLLLTGLAGLGLYSRRKG